MSQRSRRSRNFSQTQTNKILTQQTIEQPLEGNNFNIEDHVQMLVRYVINRGGEQTLIKKGDIKKNLLRNAGQNIQEIIDRANGILREVYGLDMIAIDSGKKEYMVTNILSYVHYPADSLNNKEYPKDVDKIILLLVLSHIFMTNNCVGEGSLQSFFTSLGIDIERRHPIMGNIKDYINQTLKQKKYLDIEIDPMSRKLSYSWGIRAEKEISKNEILNFVCKVYKDRMPKSWVNQYRIAQEQAITDK